MKKLQEIRIKEELSQVEIAEQLGISQQAYARYEKDNVDIPLELKTKLENILMCDLSSPNEDITSIAGFLNSSLTSYHAVDNVKTLLLNDGFIELFEKDEWKLSPNNKYFVTKNNSSIITFKVGDLNHYSFNIASCHTDSPCLKIKGENLISSPEGYRLNVEKYGGLINYSLLDIPLKIAGRILVEYNEGFVEKLYKSPFNVNIPSLCIHHNSNVNQGMELTIGRDMLPLLGSCNNFYSLLNAKEKIIDFDLYCVPAVKATYCGANNEFLVSPRIDNLTSLFSITKALISSKGSGVSIMYASDNEEIGSLSKQGAESSFLKNTLVRINESLNKSTSEFYKAISNGFVLSIDNGHAVHPNHPEKSDSSNQVFLNKGIVIKHHPNYSTDGVSSAIVKKIAEKAKVEIQDYYNNSDIRCGSTIGLITSSQLGINACDIGLGQLAMHSGIETVGKYDIEKEIDLVKTYFESFIEIENKVVVIHN